MSKKSKGSVHPRVKARRQRWWASLSEADRQAYIEKKQAEKEQGRADSELLENFREWL